METIVDTSKQVLRQLIGMKERSHPVPLEVCMLQFLYELLSQPSNDVEKIKAVLMSLLKDALTLNMAPPALFVLVAILNIYVQKVPVSEERRSRREIQVIFCLSSPTILRINRNLRGMLLFFDVCECNSGFLLTWKFWKILKVREFENGQGKPRKAREFEYRSGNSAKSENLSVLGT